ncbi:MAG: hypothetical protein ABIV47_26655 [Roseiflexaceae bacterium]
MERAILFGVLEEGAQSLYPAEGRPILHHQQRFSDGSSPRVLLRQRGLNADQHGALGQIPFFMLDER